MDTQRAIQQQGVDVRLDRVRPVGKYGEVNQSGTKLPERQPNWTGAIESDGRITYTLGPGYYEVDLMEGVNVPNNISLHFKTRSSLVRCGAIVHSGQFDAGFHTDRAGCFLHVINPITIEKGARIAQAICFESEEVENLYDGQWQGDKQRKQ